MTRYMLSDGTSATLEDIKAAFDKGMAVITIVLRNPDDPDSGCCGLRLDGIHDYTGKTYKVRTQRPRTLQDALNAADICF